ncbi:MAG: bifunctional UDP-N-acetylglucosamine diphosphorylase/glucosamine-1-phosphate N-acetyltransferase GlmU, partial [Defluviitaleaceae bacterium]|nr:bifunctional UDP-N-acetylglucosamine diphosphorylase/glucosamine-1-phosphate N-acetyltransferase GlmU [Defluviitaleaceae bacterium]
MKAIILAAGKSTRMNSDMPKVLQPVMGKPMLHYVIEACKGADIDEIIVVVGHMGGDVREASGGYGVQFVTQAERLGTGHAVMAASDFIVLDEDIIVLCGDTPLVTPELLRDIKENFTGRAGTDALIVSVKTDSPFNYGRVIKDGDAFVKIIEQLDLPKELEPVNEINTGIMCFKGGALLYGLSKINNLNKKGEYYLTDVPAVLKESGREAAVYVYGGHCDECLGINTKTQLAAAAAVMRRRINEKHMESGVTMADPQTCYIDAAVKIGRDAVLLPNVILEGGCEIGCGAIIGPGARLTDTKVGEGSSVQYSVANGAAIGSGTSVGPFAYLRPGAEVGDGCKIGDFVEIKNAAVGNGSKVPHLAYVGDADV